MAIELESFLKFNIKIVVFIIASASLLSGEAVLTVKLPVCFLASILSPLFFNASSQFIALLKKRTKVELT